MEKTQKYFLSDILVMLGRSMKHITRSMDTIISTALMPVAIMLLFVYVLAAFIMGFCSSAGILSWLAVAAILILFTITLTWVAVIAGLVSKSPDGAYVFLYPLIFLPFVSSAFVPTDTMPAVLRAFAENQPVTSIVNTIRALLNSQPVGGDIWTALAWCMGILGIAYFFAVRIYRKRG